MCLLISKMYLTGRLLRGDVLVFLINSNSIYPIPSLYKTINNEHTRHHLGYSALLLYL